MTQPRTYTRPDDTIMVEVDTHIFVSQEIAKRLGILPKRPVEQAAQ